MAKYRIVGLPKAQRGSSGITGGPEYDSRYGMMGKLGYENEFRGQKDRSNINTLSADIYGGNFGIGASGAYEFGSEKRGGFPAKNFMKTTIGGDNVRGFYGDIKGGSEIHAIKDRNNQLNFTPFGGVSVQSRPGLVTGAADNLGSKAGLNYGIGTDYTRKFKNDGLFNLYGQVMFNPVLGKNASNEALKSGNVNFAPQFNIGARYTIPLSSNSRKIKKLIAKQNEDRNEIVTPVDFVRSTENVNPNILRHSYKKYGGNVVEDLPKAQVGSSGGQWKQNPDGSWIQMADDWVAPSKKISPLVQRQQDINAGIINAGIKKAQIKQPVIYENLPKDEGILKNVAQQYIGGPDLKTVSDQAMFRQQQEAEKKEAVAQHYYAKMVQEFPGFTIEQAREDVNNPGYQHNPQKIGLGEMFTPAGIAKLASNTGSYLSNTNTGKFKWEDYYNREGLGQAWRPGTIREITDAEKKENEQSWQGKLTDIAYNPFTAAGFWVRGQKVPDNMQRDMDRGTFGYYANGQFRTDRNPLDMITDVTILGAAHSADRILERATNDVDGDFWTMETGLDAINSVFHANMLRGATKLGKTGSYYDDVMGSSTAGRNATDPDLLNLGYNPLQKTFGTTEDLIKFTDDVPFNKGLGPSQRKLLQRSTSPTTPVTPSQPIDIPDDALWGDYEMPSLNTEDWINKNGPGMFGKLKNKLKRKPKVEKPNAPETKLEGTYQDIAVQKIIKDATIDIPKAREQYFAGSNLFNPLTPSGSGFTTPLYKLPEGIDQQEFDMFASQVSAGKVPTTAVNAVFQAMIKVNPSLAKIKNVPKEDIINYASGHMPPDQIEEVHKVMSSNPWETDAPNMSSSEPSQKSIYERLNDFDQTDFIGSPITNRVKINKQLENIRIEGDPIHNNTIDYFIQTLNDLGELEKILAQHTDDYLDVSNYTGVKSENLKRFFEASGNRRIGEKTLSSKAREVKDQIRTFIKESKDSMDPFSTNYTKPSPKLGIDGINPLDNNISLKNFTKDDGSVIVDPLESLNLISQQFKGSLKKGRKAAINKGNQSLDDWVKHPATQKKVSNLYKTQRDKLIKRIDRIENQVKASEEAMQEIRNLNNDPLKSIVLDSKKLNETNALNDEYAETAKKKINELWDKIDKLDKGEREALSFTPDSKYYPLSRQVQDLFSKNSEQIHSNNKGVYYGPKNERSGSWISRHPEYSFEDIASTTIHEGTHQWTKANAELDLSGELDIIFSNINPKLKNVVITWTQLRNKGIDPATKMGADLADWGYVANPTEVHARIMQLREHFKLTPAMEVTPEMAQNILTEIKKGTTPITRADKFARMMTDAGSFANLFNGLRVMVPIAGAVGVGAATQEQDGGFIEMKLSDEEIAEYRKKGYIVNEM